MSNEKPPLPLMYPYMAVPADYLFPPSNGVVPQPFFPVNSTAAFIAPHQDLTMAISNYDNQLLQAIDQKEEQKALSLLKNPPEGWDVNKTYGIKYGQKTLLIAACQKGLLSVVKALVESHGAALAYEIKNRKKTPLHFASENDHVDVVSYLLEREKTLIDKKNGLNWTALNYAVKAGSLRMVKILVENGADLSIKSTLSDETKHTPLSLAEEYGHEEIKTYLQEKLKQNQNFSVDATTTRTSTITTAATTAIPPDITLITTTISNYDNQLLQAIDKKGEKKALSLLENPPEGWDVNKAHGSGPLQKTVLIAACQKGLLSVVKALVESHGAALTYEIKNRKKTPLHFASENDHVDVVTYLLKRDKTLIDEKNGLNWASLHFAVKAGSLRMVKILVENGADLSTLSDETKHTPLSLAEEYGHEEIKTYLQEKLKQNQNFSLDATSARTTTTPTTTTSTTTTAITPDITLTPAAIVIPQKSPKIPFLFFKNKASQMETSRKRIREEDVKNKGLSEAKTEEDVELAEPPAKKRKGP